MKIKDIIWGMILVLITLFVAIPTTRNYFDYATTNFPYLMGFIKTAILATMGELLIHRIKKGTYFPESGLIYKFIVWGFLGMIFVLIFKLFASGVVAAQDNNLLPSISSPLFLSSLLTAFMISFLMNVFFAPSFMILHRITDGYIELGNGKFRSIRKVKLNQIIDRIDWNYFFGFVVLRTIPFFWIPAHTITFLLPENYRVLMAAYLSIALGMILTLSKTTKRDKA
ncbi:MAG: hypothetical protein Q7I99_02525 [Acholeplasmataceae bacterium]|nr:hypothetical protein [Acholeplasmataceae bacterium]